jgi:hypothetical protein
MSFSDIIATLGAVSNSVQCLCQHTLVVARQCTASGLDGVDLLEALVVNVT